MLVTYKLLVVCHFRCYGYAVTIAVEGLNDDTSVGLWASNPVMNNVRKLDLHPSSFGRLLVPYFSLHQILRLCFHVDDVDV